MKNLIVIGPDNLIKGYIGNVDYPSHVVHLSAQKEKLTALHESSPGADDVRFEAVTDSDDASFLLRDISVGHSWDLVNKVGIPSQDTSEARAQATSDASDRQAMRQVVAQLDAIMDGSFSGASALKLLARAVKFLVVRELRD